MCTIKLHERSVSRLVLLMLCCGFGGARTRAFLGPDTVLKKHDRRQNASSYKENSFFSYFFYLNLCHRNILYVDAYN